MATAMRHITVDYLIKTLVKQGLIESSQAAQISKRAFSIQQRQIQERKQSGQPVDTARFAPEVIAALDIPLPGGRPGQTINEDVIVKAVALEVGLPYRKIDPMELNLEVVTKTLPKSFAMKHLVVPIGIVGNTLELAVCDPFDLGVLDDVRRVSDYEVVPILCSKEDIKKLIGEFYGFKSSIVGAETQLVGPALDLGNLEQYVRLKSIDEIAATDQHVKNAVDYLFGYAFDQRASDIHIEPKRGECRVRMRIDGVLHDLHRLPKVLHPAIVSRIKGISRLDIAEKRRPQDGRIKIDHQGKEAEVRVSTVPVAFGEKVVMRLLNPEILFRDLDDLFYSKADLAKYREFIQQPHGIILVTGPTGSGKSTTLYSSLLSLSGEEKNITTVEDPIEMVHEGFNQIAVQPQIGITFGTILRHILRQDPDIIMIGEMRDFDTAENAIQAALTGHLVLSTLHTNDAPTAITRLADLGVERFLVTSTLIGVVAQRLLRRNCPDCVEEFFMSPEELSRFGIKIKSSGDIRLMRGQGCDACRGTGYRGRVATMEVMPMSEQLSQMALAGEQAKSLKRAARKEGMSTLRENAVRMMLKGITTLQEVMRVTADD